MNKLILIVNLCALTYQLVNKNYQMAMNHLFIVLFTISQIDIAELKEQLDKKK